MGLDDLGALQPAVAHSLARMLDPTGFSDADFEALGQRFELSYEAYGALKVRVCICMDGDDSGNTTKWAPSHLPSRFLPFLFKADTVSNAHKAPSYLSTGRRPVPPALTSCDHTHNTRKMHTDGGAGAERGGHPGDAGQRGGVRRQIRGTFMDGEGEREVCGRMEVGIGDVWVRV